MLTIDDLNRIINLPSISLNINEKKVKDVIDFRDETIPFLDNLNVFTVDFINNLNGILSYWYMLHVQYLLFPQLTFLSYLLFFHPSFLPHHTHGQTLFPICLA